MSDAALVNRLRKLCLSLDDATETETFGHPTFRVSGKTFCVLDEYKGAKAIAVKVGLPLQGAFLKDERFYRTPYVGQHGWVSLKVDGRLDWREVEDLVKGSYRLMARRSTAAGRSLRRR